MFGVFPVGLNSYYTVQYMNLDDFKIGTKTIVENFERMYFTDKEHIVEWNKYFFFIKSQTTN